MSKKNGRKGFHIVPHPQDPVGEHYGTNDKRIDTIVSTHVQQAVSKSMPDVRTALHKMLLTQIGDEMLGYAKEFYAKHGRGAVVAKHEDLVRLAALESGISGLTVAYQPQSDIQNMQPSLLSCELGFMVESYDVNQMCILVVCSEDGKIWPYGLIKQGSELPQNKTEGGLQ